MTDENPLVTVRDRRTGETLEVGRAWLERWPEDFEAVTGSAPTPTVQQQTPQQPQQPRRDF